MLWKIYAWFLAFLLAVGYGVLIWEGIEVRDIVDMLISLVALIGVFGYAYKRKIISEDLWRVWFFVIIGWDIFYNLVLEDFTEFSEFTTIEISIVIIIMLILIIPEYIALFLYGFRSEALWKPQKRI